MNELQILMQVGFLKIDQNYMDFLKGESKLFYLSSNNK